MLQMDFLPGVESSKSKNAERGSVFSQGEKPVELKGRFKHHLQEEVQSSQKQYLKQEEKCANDKEKTFIRKAMGTNLVLPQELIPSGIVKAGCEEGQILPGEDETWIAEDEVNIMAPFLMAVLDTESLTMAEDSLTTGQEMTIANLPETRGDVVASESFPEHAGREISIQEQKNLAAHGDQVKKVSAGESVEKLLFQDTKEPVGKTLSRQPDRAGVSPPIQGDTKPTHGQPAEDVRPVLDFENRRLKGLQLETNHSGDGKNRPPDTEPEVVNRLQPLLKGHEENNNSLPGKIRFENGETFRPTVQPEDVINQVVKKAELLVKQNTSQMKLELKPEVLGKMIIKIAVEEGVVTARFITENHQVKQLLESNMAALRQSLESQGIRVEKAEVSVQLNNGGLFDGSENHREQSWNNQPQGFFRGVPTPFEELSTEELGADNISSITYSDQGYNLVGEAVMDFRV